MVTGYMGEIKLIEGLIVAAETLGGEVIFFSLSGELVYSVQDICIIKDIALFTITLNFLFLRQNTQKVWIWLHFYILFRMLRNSAGVNIPCANTMVGTSGGIFHAGTILRSLLYNNSSICKRSITTRHISYCSRNCGRDG